MLHKPNPSERSIFAAISPAHAVAIRLIELLEIGPKTGPTLKSALRTAETPRGLSKNQLSDATAKAKKYMVEHESATILVEKYPGGGAIYTYSITANSNDGVQSACTSVSRGLGHFTNASKTVQMFLSEQSASMPPETRALFVGLAETLHVATGAARELIGDIRKTLPKEVKKAEETAVRPSAEALKLLPDTNASGQTGVVACRVQRLSEEAAQLFGRPGGEA